MWDYLSILFITELTSIVCIAGEPRNEKYASVHQPSTGKLHDKLAVSIDEALGTGGVTRISGKRSQLQGQRLQAFKIWKYMPTVYIRI